MRILKRQLWPHSVELDLSEFTKECTEVEVWLDQRMGEFRHRWNAVYRWDHTVFYFKQGRDATLFRLTWSGV